jgi:hypothetical protein
MGRDATYPPPPECMDHPKVDHPEPSNRGLRGISTAAAAITTDSLPVQQAENRGRHRRLSDASVDQHEAEKACAHWGEGKDDCVFDVLATGDIDMATAGSY